MKATEWEFRYRAILFGLIIWAGFAFYGLDRQNVSTALGSWLGAEGGMNPDVISRAFLFLGALILVPAAYFRTWASAYLASGVVYASEVKSDSLVAGGPYRHVRNPLYFANLLLVLGLGVMMSRVGFVVSLALMTWFCYRLIFREESSLASTQGTRYSEYTRAVPRLLPSPAPRISAGAARADWRAGFKAESWYWGFPIAVVVFATTLNLGAFFAAMAVSIVLFWLLTTVWAKGTTAP